MGKLQCSPRPYSWNKGDLPLREGEGCREGSGDEGKEGKGGEERDRKRGQERDGKERKGRRRDKEREGKGETCHTNPSLLLSPLVNVRVTAGHCSCR